MKVFWWERFLKHAPDGAGGQAGGGGGDGGGKPPANTDGGGGDGGKPDDAAGLKSALEKERAQNKELRGQVKDLSSRIDELGKSQGDTEGLRKKLADAEVTIRGFELKERKGAALDEAIAAAKKDGIEVDADRARRYLERVAGEDVGALAKEAVDLFGRKTEKKDDPAPKGGGSDRVVGGQPKVDDSIDVDKLTPRELARMYRENPEGYAAVQEKLREKRRTTLNGS